jgi:hypothetical protein
MNGFFEQIKADSSVSQVQEIIEKQMAIAFQ